MILLHAQKALATRQMNSALALFDQALVKGEDAIACAAGKWECFMLLGEYEAAWKQSDLIRSMHAPDVHRLWNGEPIEGRRVMVRCLHGFGDAIQFLRFTSRLRTIARNVHVQVPPELLPLSDRIEGAAPAVTWETAAEPAPEWDVQVEVMQLPHLLRVVSDSLPQPPYLHPSIDAIVEVKQKMLQAEIVIDLPRVGLCWECGKWNTSRAVPAQLFQSLITHNAANFYNLNEASNGNAWNGLTTTPTCYDASWLGAGPLRVAEVIANLDLVITVDTMVAHIAGAMGKPVWLLLQYACDWRWMHERGHSPWYPAMRMFRQSQQASWEEVLSNVEAALKLYILEADGHHASLG